MTECANDAHVLNTCHVCTGSGIAEDFDGPVPCSRCDGRGHLHTPPPERRPA